VRDNDRIYAVIRGFGASSDGKGKGITAPNPEGQRRALRRAYENAGVDPADVDLFECHGTSTVVGDKVECDALSDLIGSGRRRRPARIGSIKSNIGHLKSAAGAASAMKAALALHHAALPPSINYRRSRPDIDMSAVPLQVQTSTEAWEGPHRICGVSSFGFGGTNFHLVMQAHTPGEAAAGVRVRRAKTAIPAPLATSYAPTTADAHAATVIASLPVSGAPSTPLPQRTVNALAVPDGLWALSADSPEELIARCEAVVRGENPAPYEPDAPLRVAAAAADIADRNSQIEKVIGAVRKGKGYDLLRQRGIAFEDVPCDGQLAFCFTGQGSQYIDMGLDLAERYPIVADTFREADEVMTPFLGSRPLSGAIRTWPKTTSSSACATRKSANRRRSPWMWPFFACFPRGACVRTWSRGTRSASTARRWRRES
jgi:acyl transferase domain-containing protein